MNGLVVIVDGYGPARQIPPFYRAKGHGCLHLQSTPAPLPGFTLPNPEHFLASLVHEGSLSRTIDRIREAARELGVPVACVVPGIEAGVDLADELSEAMQLATNGTALGRARRDKYLMAARLHELGVPAVKHIKSESADAIIAWAGQHTTWPVVVKPLDSGGTDGVYVCQNADEVRTGVASILGKTNLMGQKNREVLAQSFLRGDEYVVNSASRDGRHYICDVWRSRKRFLPGRGFIYDRELLLPFDGDVQQQVMAYTRQVLDALNVRFGPSHAEVMMTADGPVLIEVGARISGATNPAVADECVGHNQLALGVDAYVDAEAFDRALAEPHALRKHAMLVVLASDRDGEVRDVSFVDQLRRLASVRTLNMQVEVGTRWRTTVDLKSSPGHLHLVNESREALERDYESIQQIFHEAVARLS